jgi:hypothetical protein
VGSKGKFVSGERVFGALREWRVGWGWFWWWGEVLRVWGLILFLGGIYGAVAFVFFFIVFDGPSESKGD